MVDRGTGISPANGVRPILYDGCMKPMLAAMICLLVFAPSLRAAPPTEPGVTFRVYSIEKAPERIPRVAGEQTPNLDQRRDRIDFLNQDFEAVPGPLVTTVHAELLIEEAGEYFFQLTSDDGSRLFIGGRLVIDHDGRHGATERRSVPVRLEPGAHPLLIEHFDAGGSRMLRLEWMKPMDRIFQVIDQRHLRTEADPTRVTSPGFKRIEDGRRPGDGAPLVSVHPAWTLSDIRPPGFNPKVGSMVVLPDGRLVVGLFDPLQRDEIQLPDIESKEPDSLYALSNLDAADPSEVVVTRIAGDLFEPTGLCVVDGVLYVAQRKAVTRLLDLDGDGFFETHQTVGEGWEGWNYHQFAFGLVHKDGKFYTALSTAMAPPGWEGMEHNAGPNGPMRGGIVEIDPQTGDTRVIAGGTRTPNGLGLGPDGSLIYLDNQGTWMPANQFSEVIPGRFYGHYNWTRLVPKLADRFPEGGHPSEFADRPRTPASILMPQNEVNNSPTEPLTILDGPYRGQMLVGELTAGGIRRVALERVEGQLQGALFRFTQGLESGVNRMAWGPDGSLYVGGIGAGGNWNWRGTQFGLQRLTPNGRAVFEMHSVTATPDGLRVVFTRPVDPAWLAEPANYLVRSWTYRPGPAYGGPKVADRPHPVRAAEPEADGLAVRLVIEDMEPGRCYHLRTDPTSVDGEVIWSTEAWYTMNVVPRERTTDPSDPTPTLAGRPIELSGVGVGVLPPADAVTLTGRNSAAAMRFERAPFPPPALTQDDFIRGPDHLAVGFGSGDLVSTTTFGDARIHLEWFSPAGGDGQLAGNSGVYLQNRYEIQVLATPAGPNPPAANEAGAIYNIKPADHNASTGRGTWQAYDIWFRAPRFVDGRKVEDARITMYWNGRLVHDDVPIPHPTGAARAGGESAGPDGRVQTGPLRLQDHASGAEGPVRYRNIWIQPLDRTPSDGGDWLPLFETGEWMVRGGQAEFTLDKGELVGTTRPSTPNTFFTSVDAYADFELLYEALVDPRLNSGVQIRSAVQGGDSNRGGGLIGYQIELDPSARAYSGGIYDERRRGWLHPLHANPAARRAFRPGEWNRFRVVATGPIIRTWINGVPAAEIFDAESRSGHIGFQVHDVGPLAEPLEIRFRNARIRVLHAKDSGSPGP